MPVKSIVAGSDYLNVQTTSAPYIPYGSMNQGVGMVRYNTSSQSMEVYDGTSWVNIEAHTSVDLSSENKRAMDWARGQMERMSKLEEKAKTNPTIADALAALRHAEEQLRLVEILCEEEQNV